MRRRLPDKLRLRAAVILFSLCGGLLYFGGYQALVQQPVLERCGREAEFSAVAADFGQLTEQGGRVTVYPEGLRGVKAVCYGGQELAQLEPGQRITGYARWQDAGRIHENDVTTFTSRGVFALLYVQGDVTEEAGSAGSLRWLPQRTARALREKIAAIWDDETTAAFVTAELTGDRGGLSVADETAMSQAGLSHLFAVSGLHCAFLVSLLGLLLGSRRRLSAGVSMAVLAFYMLVVGLSPSVVRACIMQAFVLAAPLFKRDSDGLTSLGAALLVILLANPFAAGSISLQLSFAATLGLVWLSPKRAESVPVLHRDKPGRPMGGELPVRQRVGVRLGSGFHHSADGHLLQHPDPYRTHQQPAGRSGGGMELHGGLCDGAGGLCMDAGGPGAGLGMLRPGAVCAVGRRGAGLGSGACGVFFQRLSEILAAVCIRHVRRVPADPGPAGGKLRRGRNLWR